jgi:hypothetical protein
MGEQPGPERRIWDEEPEEREADVETAYIHVRTWREPVFVCLTIAFQPRRLMIAPAADGCKRLLARPFGRGSQPVSVQSIRCRSCVPVSEPSLSFSLDEFLRIEWAPTRIAFEFPMCHDTERDATDDFRLRLGERMSIRTSA